MLDCGFYTGQRSRRGYIALILQKVSRCINEAGGLHLSEPTERIPSEGQFGSHCLEFGLEYPDDWASSRHIMP